MKLKEHILQLHDELNDITRRQYSVAARVCHLPEEYAAKAQLLRKLSARARKVQAELRSLRRDCDIPF